MSEPNLENMTVEKIRDMAPQEIADLFDVSFVGVIIEPTPQEWRSATTYHIFGSNGCALSEKSHKTHLARNNDFIIFGKDNQYSRILLSVIDGKFVPPGELTVEQYKPFLSQSGFDFLERDVAQYNFQKQLTILLKEVIPKELVGQEARLHDGKYVDSYLIKLNNNYPLDEVLGTRKEEISKGTNLGFYVMDSPTRYAEAESVLGSILFNSAHAGLWQPKLISCTDEIKAKSYLDGINLYSAEIGGRLEEGLQFGINRAQNCGFVFTNIVGSDIVVSPSQQFAEYCIQRNIKNR